MKKLFSWNHFLRYCLINFLSSVFYLVNGQVQNVHICPLHPTNMVLGESNYFYSKVLSGQSPYNYHWSLYHNSNLVKVGTNASFDFKSESKGVYFLYLEVFDSNNYFLDTTSLSVEVIDTPAYKTGVFIFDSNNVCDKIIVLSSPDTIFDEIGNISLIVDTIIPWYTSNEYKNGHTLKVKYLYRQMVYNNYCLGISYVMPPCYKHPYAYIYEMIDLSVGINEVKDDKVHIFPNPTYNKININTFDKKIKQVSVIDLTGKQLYSQQVKNKSIIELDLKEIYTGLVFVKILFDDNTSYSEKIVIK
jgi:hypothetical protein